MRRLLPIFLLITAAWLPGLAGIATDTAQPDEAQRAQWTADAQRLGAEGFQLLKQGKFVESLDKTGQFLELRRKLFPVDQYPDGHADLANALNGMGLVHSGIGNHEQARPFYEQALAMRRKVFPPAKHPAGHPHIAISLNNVGLVRKELGDFEGALPYYEQSLAMFRAIYPRSQHPGGHSDVATCLNNLGTLLFDMGASDKARPLLEESLAMRRTLFPKAKFPDGHPQLATTHNVLGLLLRDAGLQGPALEHLEQALTMRRDLFRGTGYPDGHPDLIHSLTFVAGTLASRGEPDKALTYNEQALDLARRQYAPKKYPAGHPTLVRCLDHVGFLRARMGDVDTAIPLLDEALGLHKKLYPLERFADGGHGRVGLLTHLAMALQAKGDHDQAAKRAGEALALHKKLLGPAIASAPEADALAFLSMQVPTRDYYLSLARLDTDALELYRAVWDTKSALTRVLERRRAAARLPGADQPKVDRLHALHLQIERLLQPDAAPPPDRDRRLAALSDERDALERELGKKLPILEHFQQRDLLGPDDLVKSLPASTVFIDVCTYTRYRAGEGRKAGHERIPSYMAFIVVAGQPVRRVDLGNVVPIHRAIAAWQDALATGADTSARDEVARLVWKPLASHVPASTRTLYVSPDGDLARVPWAALPGAQAKTILLEEFPGGMAIVPHGPFLLEQLKFPRKAPAGAGSVLALGGLMYDRPGIASPYPALPGAAGEIKALRSQAGGILMVALTGAQATAQRLRDELPGGRFVHLATHGFFAEKELALQKRQAKEHFLQWSFQDGKAAPRLIAGKNPLAYTGLVLSGGEVMTGLSLVNLPLENVQLVTLSACETGLGEMTEGEGVQGLQRAFHLAGCPNVVASLWKVNDAATAALMTKFYHELWINKRPPIEALREAQLTIYRRPDLIPDLAGERGPPRLKEAVAAKLAPSPKRQATADTRLWAAFVLSGVGR